MAFHCSCAMAMLKVYEQDSVEVVVCSQTSVNESEIKFGRTDLTN